MCAEAGMQPRLGYAASPHLSLVGEGGRKVGPSPGIQNLPGSLDLRRQSLLWWGWWRGWWGTLQSAGLTLKIWSKGFFFSATNSLTVHGPQFPHL